MIDTEVITTAGHADGAIERRDAFGGDGSASGDGDDFSETFTAVTDDMRFFDRT